MRTPDIERLAEGLRGQTAGFARAVADVDPATWVPTCPEWRLRDLVGHIGQAHRWAAGIVATGAAGAVPDPRAAEPRPPSGWSRWLADGAAGLIAAVEKKAGVAVWTFLGPRPAEFWLRRMLHDTSVHHADAALVAGTVFEVAPDLAADAISEGLELVCSPGAAALKPDLAWLRGTGQTLQLRAERPPVPGWLITRTHAGVTWRRGTAAADVTVTGTPQELLLMFARRRPPGDRVEVAGDRALLDHWLANTAF